MACRFHSPTIVGWMPCLVANCAVVSSPRSASSATFALKSAEYRFRLLAILVRPSQEQTELNPLSEFAGPPQDQWPAQAEAMIDGVSIAKAAERCDVDYTTAFRWRHRFLLSLAADKPEVLSGIVEGDETFILESFKGQRSGMPKARKRGGK